MGYLNCIYICGCGQRMSHNYQLDEKVSDSVKCPLCGSHAKLDPKLIVHRERAMGEEL